MLRKPFLNTYLQTDMATENFWLMGQVLYMFCCKRCTTQCRFFVTYNVFLIQCPKSQRQLKLHKTITQLGRNVVSKNTSSFLREWARRHGDFNLYIHTYIHVHARARAHTHTSNIVSLVTRLPEWLGLLNDNPPRKVEQCKRHCIL